MDVVRAAPGRGIRDSKHAGVWWQPGFNTTKNSSACAGFLEGIKSKDRAILKLNKVGFKYPGMEKNVISNVTGQFSLNSRVAVIGPNGAGKSTMIKILTGEIEALEGIVWKHPNLRVAYVAQHAFHHIEQVWPTRDWLFLNA